MVKILVTGGAGYIGSHTVVELQEAGYEAVIVDNLSNSSADVVDGIERITGVRPVLEKVDCTDIEAMRQVFSRHKNIAAIIHFAASKAVGESVSLPLRYYHNNLVSLLTMLTLMNENKINNIVFSSSCTVYGQPDTLPVSESAPRKKAESPYGNTKQICEDIITDAAAANKNLYGILLRYFNPIGAHPSANIGELPLGVPNNLVPFITQTAAGIHGALSVYGNDYNTPDGSCIRDYIDVVDLAKAHVVAAERMIEYRCKKNVEIYNLGTGRGVSVLELVRTFEEVNGVKLNYKITGRREGDIEQIWAVPSLAEKELGWRAMRPLAETLKAAWRWQQKIMNGSK